MDSINLEEKLASFDEHWSPKIVARFNDHDVMVGKVQGEFVWHKHDETDDFFLVLKGRLTIQLRDGDVELAEGGNVRRPSRGRALPEGRRGGARPRDRTGGDAEHR
jgi:mannose-6-phosphate isomerase-like protein (cupin superfamily)